MKWDREKTERLLRRQRENCSWAEWEGRKALPAGDKVDGKDASGVLLERVYPATVFRLEKETCSSQ